jgi:hypothetical protein
MAPSRQLHKEEHLAKDALAVAGLLEQLEQPAAEKACRGCNVPYTDATSSGAKTKKNGGYCSKTCRENSKQCEHGRRPKQCKDCGTGYCVHNRQKSKCKDCGTGYCKHGRQKGTCYCKHGLLQALAIGN